MNDAVIEIGTICRWTVDGEDFKAEREYPATVLGGYAGFVVVYALGLGTVLVRDDDCVIAIDLDGAATPNG